ncbi:murein L,D-transpeptidase catalytic domain family protein [Variovorax sp. OV329]|uniref:murein L,D-transpeptidase catalytic domain family protein n=1 Tax=Variovorax sp. OV329 TaxID=1882825 RepID=UPI0008EB150D|nr:murein L,D-transpeptidase catalytic domain family protein [Variovorax sp. OV329]SFL87741.1 L,D-transpeptidase catalytic domain [Variovorax sp. OV329]
MVALTLWVSRPARLLPSSRRLFVASTALAGLGWIAAPKAARAEVPDDAPAVTEAGAPVESPNPLLERARAELARLGEAIALQDLVAVADFSQPSHLPRFHLIDMQTGEIEQSFLVAHGRGSDPRHVGRVLRFSNEVGSNASSEGAYRVGERYVGKHGRSIRLDGLDPSNSNAEVRAIVIHAAPYVGPEVLQAQGKLGRSEGCFVFSEEDHEVVLDRLGPDRLLLAGMF